VLFVLFSYYKFFIHNKLRFKNNIRKYIIIMQAITSTNDKNNYSISELNYIREVIENMNKFNQVEILKILNKHEKYILNENKYGIHINLSEVDKEIIDELAFYIKYVNTQEHNLISIEQQKEDFRNTYFSKDIKDKN
jgi:hypothetical protein